MPNFWERKPDGHWAHGFLICGDTQTSGYEFHGTFPRDGRLPHISIYEIGNRSRKIGGNIQFRHLHGTVGLNASDRRRFLDMSGVSEDKMNDFIREVWSKHNELNAAPVAATAAAPSPVFLDSDFPALVSPGPSASSAPPPVSTQSAPPLLSDRALGLSPAAMADMRSMPSQLQAVLMESGAFD